MSFPLISVIVPVYNTELFLSRCLDSLIGQTYKELEIICVDDGSTDNSLAILLKYKAKDARIKVIHQENAGVSAARNRGLDAASGEFVAFVDADDWVEPDTYKKVVDQFCADVDFVCFGVVVDGEAEPGLEEYCNKIPDGESSVTTELLIGINTTLWNKVYRLDLIRRYGICFPVGAAYGEDIAFFYCYAAVSTKLYGIKEVMYHYVQHAGSAMSSPLMNERRAADLLTSFDCVQAFYSTHGVKKRMLPISEKLFEDFVYYAELGGNLQLLSIRSEKAARKSGIWGTCCNLQVLMIKKLNLSSSSLGAFFHWFLENRECFGVAGKSVISVTYEPECRIYRFLGCRVGAVYKR